MIVVLIHRQKLSLSKTAYHASLSPCSVNIQLHNRHFAAATRPEKKTKKDPKGKASDEKQDEIEKIKSYHYMEGEPEDDVYLKRLYPRQIYDVEKAIHLLKKYQILDFTYPKQGVYLDLTLDMSLQKKKKVEPFASVLRFPYPFTSEINKVAVFTGNASETKIAEENGAAFAGGTNLIQQILADELHADFYVAVPEIMPELNPLKKKLKKRFPKLARKSIGRDIPQMLEFFKTGHEIVVDEEKENFLQTKIATKQSFDNASENLTSRISQNETANMKAVISDVCKHRPLSLGPFVIRAFLRSSTSEGLVLKIEPLLPKEAETQTSNKEAD
ncbi:PREDICTED: 39S ribosomal protein L1, mitochondrial-like [Chrysochloris asiatica]|uniref:Large ribosomal subunit protein uL1m n=1 Tax=Chrysochloris asiatica TaxID=185453 RepID=A0A9B0U3S7_CHRAS|nr:PREDICTED: 39S ribosomal protein L1, mitochondrial-like [Chrysochloris asiatica]